ncbi:MAG: two-component regulator propeller domain-containing protein [Gemmatimonadaceae bacterium]
MSGLDAASRLLNPRQMTRKVALVDGHDLQFKQLSAEGLSQTRVGQIAQDEQGFMWFGTSSGLQRYDGHELRVFRHDARNKNSLTGVVIHSLLRDRENRLWVGSDGFLDSFDSENASFTPHALTPVGERPAPINVGCMSDDASGVLWLCTRNGLYRFDTRTQRTTVLRHRAGDAASLASDAVRFVGEDNRGALWVGTAAGLDVVDRSSQKVVSHLPLAEPPGGMVVHEDRAGVLWIIHGDGQLSVLDRSANVLWNWQPTSADADVDAVAFGAMLEDREGTMWFGTQNHGVLKFDRAQNRFVRYTSDPTNPHSISDRRVNVLYQDREGLIWVGMQQSAPNYFLPRPPSFQSLRVAGRQPTLVSAILRDRTGVVWLGLDRGMRTVDRVTWKYRDVPGVEREETTSAVESAPGVFWIGTAGQGLLQFDQRSGKVKTFRHDARRSNSLPSDFVEQVKLDGNGAVWAVTWRGLARFDSATSGFATVMPDGAPPELTFHTATFAASGVVWIGSNLGLHRFDPRDRTFQWFRHDNKDESSLSNDRVNSILESADGSIWIGTPVGLDHWNANAKPVARFTQTEGLPGTAVSCILEDAPAVLWLSTDRGISRLNGATGQFKSYGTADGLPGVNMTGWDSCTRDASGEMFFAGFAGAVAFHPKNVADRDYVPPVVLTRFRLLDSSRVDGSASDSSITVGRTSVVKLRPSQNKFSVEFAALSFLSPETNRFRYRMAGLQDTWTQVRADQRVATYMALPAGSYSFQVQGATGHGAWSVSPATLRIVILPPWWESLPFCILLSVILAGALYLAYTLRVRQLAYAYNVRLEERWAERTRIARELHDTLLQGFQGLMFRLQAVRELLPAQVEKAVPVLDVALQRGEVAIDDARRAVSDLRAPEKVDRDFDAGLVALAAVAAHLTPNGETPSWKLVTKGRVREIPPTVLYELYQIVQEAISNAFQHAHAQHITVNVRYHDDSLSIIIEDDGAGCDEQSLREARYPGHFGIQGIIERAEILGGEIKLRSKPGQGTRVSVSVPGTVAYRKVRSTAGAR